MKGTVPATLKLSLARLDNTDTAGLAALINLCYRGEGSWTTESKLVAGPRVTHERVRAIGARPEDEELLVLREADNGLVGCVWVGRSAESLVGPLDEVCGHLGMLSVSPEWQQVGVGKMLIQLAGDRCALRYGVRKMTLEVLSVRHELIEWYTRRGYVNTKRSTPAGKIVSGNDGEKLLVESDFILMEKELGPVQRDDGLGTLGPGGTLDVQCGAPSA